MIQIIELARQAVPDSSGLFVTNGFFLDRHPDLPRALIDNGFRMDVSQHGNAPAYRQRFTEVILWPICNHANFVFEPAQNPASTRTKRISNRCNMNASKMLLQQLGVNGN